MYDYLYIKYSHVSHGKIKYTNNPKCNPIYKNINPILNIQIIILYDSERTYLGYL